jgi:hypothetical protein
VSLADLLQLPSCPPPNPFWQPPQMCTSVELAEQPQGGVGLALPELPSAQSSGTLSTGSFAQLSSGGSTLGSRPSMVASLGRCGSGSPPRPARMALAASPAGLSGASYPPWGVLGSRSTRPTGGPGPSNGSAKLPTSSAVASLAAGMSSSKESSWGPFSSAPLLPDSGGRSTGWEYFFKAGKALAELGASKAPAEDQEAAGTLAAVQEAAAAAGGGAASSADATGEVALPPQGSSNQGEGSRGSSSFGRDTTPRSSTATAASWHSSEPRDNWQIDPRTIQLCTHRDGALVALGSGGYGKVGAELRAACPGSSGCCWAELGRLLL